MICPECADSGAGQKTGLCIHCRERKIEELKEEIQVLENDD